jgi:CubicO group peptidase (beta-lactamase class C family)
VEAVKPYNARYRRAGTLFAYASVETQVLGLVLRSAVGRPVTDYLQEKIWEPMGAEADATWLIDRSGQEATYCCLNAVLRDYARLGLLLAHDGRLGDRQIIPESWLHAATTVPADSWHLKPYAATPYFGYGYQTWIFPGKRRMSPCSACTARPSSSIRRAGWSWFIPPCARSQRVPARRLSRCGRASWMRSGDRADW